MVQRSIAGGLRRARLCLALAVVLGAAIATQAHAQVANDFAMSAIPVSLTISQGGVAPSTISTAVLSGSAETVNLSVSGLPSGITALLQSTSVTTGNSTILMISVSKSMAGGNYAVIVTGTSVSTTHQIGVTVVVPPLPPPPPANDFSISVTPAVQSIARGSFGSASLETVVTSGSSETVSLSVSGQPTGVTAVLVPTTVASGGSSTLFISASSRAALASSALTVTGRSGATSHQAVLNLTVTVAPDGIVNGGFEQGSFTGWFVAGQAHAIISSDCHSGTYCARAGSTSATVGDSYISQTFTAPAGATGLSLWYKQTCRPGNTSLPYFDSAAVYLYDSTSGFTLTLLGRQCATTSWTNVNGPLSAGHVYTLMLTSRDLNNPPDPTYTDYDDVTIIAPPPGITNGGFELGTSGWTTSGTASTVNIGCHGGSSCAQAGAASATNGDSTLSQTFQPGAGQSQLSVWYSNHCPDTVVFYWVTITLRDDTTSTTTTMLARRCAPSPTWTNVTAPVRVGHAYTLTLINHDDNYSADPTYTLFDDVVVK